MKLTPPETLTDKHACNDFDCGEESLNRWLKEHGHRSEGKTSRSYVVCDTSGSVVGYYCLAAGSLAREAVPKKLQRNSPDPVPIIVLGRLAVDLEYQGQGIGSSLVLDAMRRAVAAAHVIGARGLVVNVLNEEVMNFYLSLGFEQTPLPDTVIIPIETISRAMQSE